LLVVIWNILWFILYIYTRILEVGIITMLCFGFVKTLLKCKPHIKFLGGKFETRLS